MLREQLRIAHEAKKRNFALRKGAIGPESEGGRADNVHAADEDSEDSLSDSEE